MRRTPIVGVVAGLALALAACGSDDGGGNDGGGTAKQSAEAQLSGRGPITFVSGKDTSRNRQKQVDAWNKDHPSEQARIIELPESADQQRQQIIQNAQTKSDAYTILNMDVVWTAEFAANRWLAELPKSQFDLSKLLPPTVSTSQYRDRLYAVPLNSDGGLLYYRKDLLDAAGVSAPPKTWDELWAACDKVKQTPKGKGVSCYAGQFDKYEGLTVNVSEVINGAGGAVVDASGKPTVNTPEAKKGLDVLVQAVKDGRIPKQAITFKEEEGRRYFESGKLLFHRQWPYQYALSNTKGTSKVAGKFAVAPLPGVTGPGASTLGGHNLAISAFAKNKATAADFIKYITAEDAQRADLLATSQAPTIAALYDDPDLVKKYPYLPTLKAAILGAKARPIVVKYGDVTAAIQEETYSAITGKTPSEQALSNLQTKLGQLIQP
jgi:multiple sugar transport system substrate-binding protein